jgi:hypothetical protein
MLNIFNVYFFIFNILNFIDFIYIMIIQLKKSAYIKFSELIFVLILIIGFINPYVENIMYYDPLWYMLEHYSLYTAGILLGNRFLKGNNLLFIIGILPAVIWHFPLPFLLGASFFNFRVLSELTLFIGGVFLGSSLDSISFRIKIIALSLWMIGDTILSILFIFGIKYYTNEVFPFSNYSPYQLPIVGIAMLILMNVVIAYIIYVVVKSYLIKSLG